jgi:hypothetical protein
MYTMGQSQGLRTRGADATLPFELLLFNVSHLMRVTLASHNDTYTACPVWAQV